MCVASAGGNDEAFSVMTKYLPSLTTAFGCLLKDLDLDALSMPLMSCKIEHEATIHIEQVVTVRDTY